MIKTFRTFKEACDFYSFPGSHQIGSFGNAKGILRSYSNGTPGKDFVLNDEKEVLYKLKDDSYREKFNRNMVNNQHVRIFLKVNPAGNPKESYVKDLGLFAVVGFKEDTQHVRMVAVTKIEQQICVKRAAALSFPSTRSCSSRCSSKKGKLEVPNFHLDQGLEEILNLLFPLATKDATFEEDIGKTYGTRCQVLPH